LIFFTRKGCYKYPKRFFKKGGIEMILPNIKVERILYATDLSEGARNAFVYAIILANSFNAKITILHVLPGTGDQNIEPLAVGYIGKEKWLEIKKKHYENAKSALIGKRKERNAIKEVLHQFSETGKDKGISQYAMTDEIVIEESENPANVILEQADKKKCDIIVMGTRGIGAIAKVFVGSTALRVIRHSKKPVFVIPFH